MLASQGIVEGISKIRVIIDWFDEPIPVITLIRTDTTLDLSQKARMDTTPTPKSVIIEEQSSSRSIPDCGAVSADAAVDYIATWVLGIECRFGTLAVSVPPTVIHDDFQ
ncbi:hypothetical protein O181_004962 [Austropuccinia psidii MF-1]|uniref:Uncharacterized protein n=1 Tax=Austropuccinia psidii MF-1 TaxID=1389203 RepID=A0A9Q3BH97_9BASI|nr:hypothetical protein [Austropuccinia psidii MF-1]